jgi:hypothetical protein
MVHITGEAAHAVALDEGHHVVFHRRKIVGELRHRIFGIVRQKRSGSVRDGHVATGALARPGCLLLPRSIQVNAILPQNESIQYIYRDCLIRFFVVIRVFLDEIKF